VDDQYEQGALFEDEQAIRQWGAEAVKAADSRAVNERAIHQQEIARHEETARPRSSRGRRR
jgi:hypothetical protein